MPISIQARFVPAIIMFAVGITVAGIDIYIPSLPHMQQYFNTSEEVMQFSISLSIIGSSIVTIFLGQLADASGRRRLLILFQSLYAITSFIAAFSPSIEIFNILRLITGITSTGAFAIGFVVIGDLFDEKKASVYYAYITSSMLIALVLAPFIGGIFADMYRWDYSFIFLGTVSSLSAISIWLFMPETLAKKRPFSWREIWQQNKSIVVHPTFFNYTILHSLLIGGILAFFANASFYYIEQLGLTPGTYAKHQVSIAIVNLIASLLTPRFFRYFGIAGTLRMSLVLAVSGVTLFTVAAIFTDTIPIVLTIAAGIYVLGAGLSFIACVALVMNAFPEQRATVSSMITLVRGILLVVCISIGSFFYHGEAVHIAYALILFTVLALALYFWQRTVNHKG